MARSNVRSLYDTIAGGATPCAADLEAEGLSPRHQALVRKSVTVIHARRDEGHKAEARALARDFSDQLEAILDADPDYEAPAAKPGAPGPEATPRELAEHVVRASGGNL